MVVGLPASLRILCRLTSGNPPERNGNTGSVRLNLPKSGSRVPRIGHMVRAAGGDVARTA